MNWLNILYVVVVLLAIVGFVLAIVALVQANSANDKAVNYTALKPEVGHTILKISESTALSTDSVNPSLVYEINIPLSDWKYDDSVVSIAGNITTAFTSDQTPVTLDWRTKYSKNGGEQMDLDGANYQSTSSTETLSGTDLAVSQVGINGITLKNTFKSTDTLTLYVYGYVFTPSNAVVNILPQNQVTGTSDAAITYGPVNISA